MPRYALIADGVVTNVAVGDAEWAVAVGAVRSDEAQIGWIYADGVFTPPPESEPGPRSRRAVRKLLIVDRLIAADLADTAVAKFTREPVTKMRWDAALSVWSDDAWVIQFLVDIGADPGSMLAPE